MKYKQRASSAGNITSQPRAIKDREAGKLAKGVETIVQDWLKEVIYGVEKEFGSKYTEKGIIMEDAAIEMAIKWLELPILTTKNKKYFEDEYFTGTPDLILEDEILDIKCSWDCFSFPLFEDELPEKIYDYQLQVYMHLTGKRKARVVYVLMNTPEEIAKWEDHHDYNAIDKKYRIKTFEVAYDKKKIELLQEQVIRIRKYINQLTNK